MSSRNMTIYVPPELRARMAKVKGVSWSQLACEAFERKLGELASLKKEKSMDEVVQRLRASKLESDSEAASEGREEGRTWAKDQAEAVDLKRLADFMDRVGADAFIRREGSGAAVFLEVIDPHGECPNFWGTADNASEIPSDEHVQGFAEGAMDVWRQVKDRL